MEEKPEKNEAKLTLRITLDLRERLVRAAKAQRRSTAGLIKFVLEEWLERDEQKRSKKK